MYICGVGGVGVRAVCVYNTEKSRLSPDYGGISGTIVVFFLFFFFFFSFLLLACLLALSDSGSDSLIHIRSNVEG